MSPQSDANDRGWPLKQAISAILLGFVVYLWLIPQCRAEEFPICSMPRDQFVEAAFPDTSATKLHGGKLLKYASPPALIVLAPQEKLSLEEQIDVAFSQIAGDDLVKPFRPFFVKYGSFAELQDIVGRLEPHSVFVLIAEAPDESSEEGGFRTALQSILGWPKLAESLIDQSKLSRGFSARNRTNLMTGEVTSTAVIIKPKYQDAQIALMVYLAYYGSLAPGAASDGQRYFSGFFEGSPEKGVRLTDFGRKFFHVFSDDRVTFGMTRDSFVECF